MLPHLALYPDKAAASLLREGFSSGFRIPSHAVGSVGVCRNLSSALEKPGVAEKVAKEVALGRVVGPFSEPPLPDFRVSPLGVVPKKEPNKFRLIHHLSFPKGSSVNDGIDPDCCSVSYASFDAAVAWVRKFGKGALLAKTDVEAAFRLLPVHPDSFRLLGFCWEGQFYVDCCLPMGCSISCAYFETFSTFLEWVVKREAGWSAALHYLDDFLFIGPAGSKVCSVLLHTMERVAQQFGVPLAPDKTEGPATVVKFLGIVLDSVAMECRLPLDKVQDLLAVVGQVRRSKKVQLRQVQSLLGKLNFACRIIPMGRIFCRRLAQATAGVSVPHHFLRLPSDVREDLAVWEEFLGCYNGRAIFMQELVSNDDLELFTDASGAIGFGAYFQGQWCAGEWPESWRAAGFLSNLALLELFPIVVATVVWSDRFQNRRVRFRSDNLGVVQAINRQSANSPPVVHLLRRLVLNALSLNAHFVALQVPGVRNSIADALSRFQWDRFRGLAPEAEQHGRAFPLDLWTVALE